MSDYICKSCEHYLVCKHADNTITSCNQYLGLVRCKDCKHYNVFRLECHNGHMNGYIAIDGFCSYGERKDND